MATQVNYAETMRPGLPGQIVDMIVKTLVSRDVEDAAGIGFGVPAFQGQNDKGIKNSGTAAEFVGITVRDRSVSRMENGFARYDSARVMTQGSVWVLAPAAVAAGDPVVLGGVTIPGARWDTSTTAADQVAQVRLGVVAATEPTAG